MTDRTIIVKFEDRYAPEIRRIRNQVFTGEQGIAQNLDFDGQDAGAAHVLIVCDGECIATGRILPDGHIGRLAVLAEFRRQGFGAKAVLGLVEHARSTGLERVYLGSQVHAVGFYEGLGFTPYGDPYIEAGIQHIHMEKHL